MRHKENYCNNYLDEPTNPYIRERLYDTLDPSFYEDQESASPKQKEQTQKRPNDYKWFQKIFSRKQQ